MQEETRIVRPSSKSGLLKKIVIGLGIGTVAVVPGAIPFACVAYVEKKTKITRRFIGAVLDHADRTVTYLFEKYVGDYTFVPEANNEKYPQKILISLIIITIIAKR